MHVNWSDLASVALVSLVAAVALIALFSAGVRSLGKRAEAAARGGSSTLALASATVCFGLFTLIALFGLLIIVFPGVLD